MPSKTVKFTPEEEALLRGLWVNGKRLADVADDLGLSERHTARKAHAAGVPSPGRGRPKGAKDSPNCDRQRDKRSHGSSLVTGGAFFLRAPCGSD